ncbi:hypothetical protein ARMGADRAFT_1045928 [Armillaria gallica]|uniref:CxC2-like cysteine cluster KDZ transposase-associated domain-containing protein n=1 Tax=Armillaria gallica TaxID=47427 RepID=A0A2H3DRP8_ARMGA|nr:hypothetical protein ARMGADRAFT_1045928 [Armillaria gallica]
MTNKAIIAVSLVLMDECSVLGALWVKCILPVVIKSFVVIDVDGIHTVQMGFCNCTQCIEQHVQLLRSHLWPMTTIYPQTAATFRVLHLFQVLSFMSKVSAYEFYHTLAWLSDSTGLNTPPRGRWKTGKPQRVKTFVIANRLFLAVDANFWLHHLNVSSEDNDPSLNCGYAYFKYGKIIPAEEKSTCSQGVAVTGVGAMVCGRHDMKLPLSISDLQKGERYINMDYFVLSTLACSMPPDLVISYDIACQWHKNFFARINKYLSELQPDQLECNILYLVPNFHLPAHILKCCNDFSFKFSAKVGRTDGEVPERMWATTNALANSTKEMGPGSWRDTLDDHFGDYNWCKIVIMAQTICQRFQDAFSAHTEHVLEFMSYEDALQTEHEMDRTKPNPFAPTLRPVMENAVRLELAREEKQETKIEIRHNVSPSKFITQGLQLEEAQYANRISCKIDAWIDVQKTYMPRTTLLWARDDDRHAPGVEVHASKVPLYFPSHALRLNAVHPSTQNTVINDERRLCLAQAHDTLATLHDHLLLKSYLMIWHQRFSRGQQYRTKANVLMHRVETKIQADAARYRHVYNTLEAVSAALGHQEWKGALSPLKPEDGTSEGQCTLSWIWKTNLQGGEKGLQEALHIEWCKSRTRAQHWQEECDLLMEEIHQIKVTFQNYFNVWEDRAAYFHSIGHKHPDTVLKP